MAAKSWAPSRERKQPETLTRSFGILMVWSGSPGALLRRGPLRTVRATFTAHGSSKSLGRGGCSAGWAASGSVAPSAVFVDKASFLLARGAARDGDRVQGDRLAGGRRPLFPLFRTARWVIGVQQQTAADRAPAVLLLQQHGPVVSDRRDVV